MTGLLTAALAAGGLFLAQQEDGDSDRPGPVASQILPARGAKAPGTDIGRIYAAAGPGVVSVQVGGASGTGFLLDSDGTIITNAHVAQSADSAQVRFGDDGSPIEARVLGTDPSSDLALLGVDPAELGDAKPLPLADSAKVSVGDDVVAIGHPFGLERTATAGIVSGLGREIEAPNGFQIGEVIQTDAPINPGNSGGPLLDSAGRVIGVNSQIATAGARGNVGIGFAVPSNTLREVAPLLKAGQGIERAYLGVSTAPAASGGAAIAQVVPGGPADVAGLRAGSSVIVGIEGRDVRSPGDVVQAISERQPGDTIRMELLSGGQREELTVKLGTRPERSP